MLPYANPVTSLRLYCLTLLVLVASAFAGSPAIAREMLPHSCVLSTSTPATLQEARSAPGWVCGPEASDIRGTHAWMSIPGTALPQQEVVLVSEAMPVDSLEIVIERRSGDVSTQLLTAGTIAEHWTTGTRFEYPLELRGEQIESIHIRADRPLGREVLSKLRLEDADVLQTERRSTLLLMGMVIGMMILTVLASLFLAAALRNRAAWYHFAYSTLLLVYVCSSGSILFLFFPEMTLFQRSVISYASLSWAVALIAPFTLEFLERNTMTPWMRGLIVFTGVLAFCASVMLPVGEALGINLRTSFHLVFIPAIFATVVAAGIGLARKSRFTKAFVLVWSVPFLFLVERVARTLGLYELPTIFDFTLYVALAFEAAAMTVALAWRIRTLQSERDGALAQRELLASEARTDKLTGLPNRRDYESWQWRKGQYIGLCDLDHFKQLNDAYGHSSGDAALQAVGMVMLSAMDSGRILRAWRIGGEEFALVVEAANITKAGIILNEVRESIPGEIGATLPGIETIVTASMGLSAVTGGPIEDDFQEADRQLYSAKMKGRDQINFRSGETSAEVQQFVDADEAGYQLRRSRNVS